MIAIPKPRPALLDKRDQASDKDATDRRERQRCKERSAGRCEVRTWVLVPGLKRKVLELVRCKRQASQNHHLISGIGRRNIGDSILAEHRLATCEICHKEITGHVLKPEGEAERHAAATVTYHRVE